MHIPPVRVDKNEAHIGAAAQTVAKQQQGTAARVRVTTDFCRVNVDSAK